ncbi:MAG: DUF1049 domain-containing protein [Frankiaceae bacterium]|nr:DUF1049 domain-containing protein [Frankiaceae bacterium]MBV9870301.1 DUF1049 domain-containing protein [Frankiaceae bacterium]
MSNDAGHEPVRAERTRTSSTLVAVSVAVIFLVLLIVFIAQNNRSVPLHFLGWSGTVSEALAILGSAVAGAVLVLAVGLARIIQLRVGTHRHNRSMAKQEKTARKGGYISTTTSDGEPDAVSTED